MSHSIARFGIVVFVVIVALTACRGAPCVAAERPNVVVILSDDQGWGDLSVHGNVNLATPHIDSLARDGALFDRFFVCPVCAPTRAEFFTGRYYARTGVSGVSTGTERLNLDEITIADTFKAAGYATGAFGKWHNGTQPPYHPNNRGFDEYYGFTSGHWGLYFDPPLDHNGKRVQGQGYITDDLTSHAIEFIKKNKDRPFFCYVPYNTPHSPMQVPDRFFNKFAGMEPAMRNRDPESEDIATTRAALAMCENIDSNVGRILETLDQLNLADDTIVIYFSDNGPNSWRWNGDMKGRKGSIDEGGVRVPLLIRWPGHIPTGLRVAQIAGAIDLLPTLADMSGIKLVSKKPLDGKSIEPLLLGTAADWPDRMIFSCRGDSQRDGKPQVSVRTQRFRFDSAGRLFDIPADPGQRTNVAEKYPELVARLSKLSHQFAMEVQPQFAASKLRPFTVGYGPSTTLPARDGVAHGNIQRSNRAPNNSYFTNWTSAGDSITWDIDVGQTGTYEAIVYYTSAAKDVGSTIELVMEGQDKTGTTITQAHDPPLLGKDLDRCDRGAESYVKDFKPLAIGTIQLRKGRGTLLLRATDVAGSQVMDVLQVVLNLRE